MQILQSRGINIGTAMSYTLEENGVAERENRILVEGARSIIHANNLLVKLWIEAINIMAHVLNQMGPSSIEEKTPTELWSAKENLHDLVNHFWLFGTKCFIQVPKQRRKKWDRKGIAGRFVGYCADKNGYRIWIEKANKVIKNRKNEKVEIAVNSRTGGDHSDIKAAKKETFTLDLDEVEDINSSDEFEHVEERGLKVRRI